MVAGSYRHAAEARLALPLPATMSKIIAAWAMTQTGEIGRGAQQMETEFRNFLHGKQRAYLTFLGTLVAGAKLAMNRTEEVLNLLDEIEQLSIETHQQMFIPDLHRLRAEALRRLDRRHEGIEQQYRLALRLARQRGAPALELRAATGLASWLAEAARCKEAHDLLRPVYDEFTEGLGTRDLKTARMLLGQLA